MEDDLGRKNSLNLDRKMSMRWRSASLDEAMEQIFHPFSERFSLADLASEHDVDINSRFSEHDYQSHKRESLHHHQPLHKLHHRHKRPSHKIDHEEPPGPSRDEKEKETTATVEDPLLSIPEEGTRAITQEDNGVNERITFYVDSPPSSETSVRTPRHSLSRRLSNALQNITSPLLTVLKKQPQKRKLSSTPYTSPSLTLPSTSASTSDSPLLPSSITDGSIAKPCLSSHTSGSTQHVHTESVHEKPKVTFQIGEEVVDEVEKTTPSPSAPTTPSKSPQPLTPKKRHSRRHRHDTLTRRQHQGSDLESKVYHDVLEPEEAELLQTVDIDDMASHRFDDPKAIRRHKISGKSSASSFSRLGERGFDGRGFQRPPKKVFDHEPHEIFVELDELLFDEAKQELHWRETARWIKYEEDVEVAVDRWGKPHIPSLSFHSLINLRHCLENGAVLLDLEETEFIGIVEKMVDGMIFCDNLEQGQRHEVISKLLVRHRRANERTHPNFLRRSTAGFASVNALGLEKKSPLFRPRNKTENEIIHALNSNSATTSAPETAILIPSDGSTKNVEMISSSYPRPSVSFEDSLNSSISRRVPENAEGTTVLVGALDTLDKPATAFVRLSEGQIIPNLLEITLPVRFVFVLLGPQDPEFDYHEIGRSISTLMSNRAFYEVAYQANDRKDLLSGINSFLDDSVVLPPGDVEKPSLLPVHDIRKKSIQYRKKTLPEIIKEEPALTKLRFYDPLRRTGRCFGGFFHDIKYRFPWYGSDIRDGLNTQCFASMIFIYFAALSGAIAFGGLLGDKTGQLIGVSETLITTCVSGIVFSLLACQPLVILGTTGPVLLFDEILFQFSQSHQMNFLRLRIWVGFWTAIIATILVAFEGSSLVRFFSRFMQEIYATIISMLFIFESFSKLHQVFVSHPLQLAYNDTGQNSTVSFVIEEKYLSKPNTALLSLLLMIGTFYIAFFLRHFRNSNFLGRSARTALGDFGVPIAMAVMVSVDYSVRDVYTQKLNVPSGLQPSSPKVRGWLISPWPITVVEFFTAAVAGLLIFILLFLETLICELIISKKERKIKKGSGFHADMMLVSYISIGSAVIGGPWISAATVRSISHVSSLTVWSKTHAPGTAPHIVEVKEQRLTNFVVALLVGISVLMTPVLRQVPVSVLFGVFLYMGVSALSGIQLYERILLLFMPAKHHPDYPFVRSVRTCKMHMYTVIQIVCIAVLWTIKSTILAPGFPFGLLALVIVHSQIKRFFTPEEFSALDGEDQEEEETKDIERDFYQQTVA